MKTSKDGRDFIKKQEGIKYDVYLDGGGVPTIGVGHTTHVYEGMPTASEEQVDKWLTEDLCVAESAVNSFVHQKLTQNEYDALVSFIFNIGVTAFKNSTLLKLLNKGDKTGAAAQFLRWNQDNGKVVDGLTKRRVREKTLFLTA